MSVHRLVQAVTLDQMPADLAAEWQEAAAALIEAALPDDPDSPADWPAFAALLPHARTALPPRATAWGKSPPICVLSATMPRLSTFSGRLCGPPDEPRRRAP